MSWHYYCWVSDWNGGSNNDPYNTLAKFFCDELLGPMVANTADLRSMEIGGAKLLTEVRIYFFNNRINILQLSKYS